MSARQHLLAILLLPFTGIVFIPFVLLTLSIWTGFSWMFLYPVNFLTLILGCIFIILGLIMLGKTNHDFARVGKGTLAPCAPTRHFVAVGLYRYVRNPMILGVLLTLLGETIIFGSVLIFIWLMLFGVMNHIWFVLREEPELEQRFGNKYRQYKANVPRWIPRRHPWKQNSTPNE